MSPGILLGRKILWPHLGLQNSRVQLNWLIFINFLRWFWHMVKYGQMVQDEWGTERVARLRDQGKILFLSCPSHRFRVYCRFCWICLGTLEVGIKKNKHRRAVRLPWGKDRLLPFFHILAWSTADAEFWPNNYWSNAVIWQITSPLCQHCQRLAGWETT